MNEQIGLNEHQRRRLLVSCQYIDRLLASIERVVAGTSLSPFPRYLTDLTPQEQRKISERVAYLRSQILGFLEQHGIPIPAPAISARHSIMTSFRYIDIAVEELKPRYLGGYGVVPPALAPALTKSVEELQRTVKAAISSMKQPLKTGGGPETTAS
jgi:hypothetical protein